MVLFRCLTRSLARHSWHSPVLWQQRPWPASPAWSLSTSARGPWPSCPSLTPAILRWAMQPWSSCRARWATSSSTPARSRSLRILPWPSTPSSSSWSWSLWDIRPASPTTKRSAKASGPGWPLRTAKLNWYFLDRWFTRTSRQLVLFQEHSL